MGDPNLVTTCNFHGQEYLFKMNVLCNTLDLLITDKNSGEEWQCSYDATYIENLTQKTGNFKQFDIFIAMIKSGLLRTSESVSLDLLTFEDLELLRSRKITKSLGATGNNNRRYLIVTYIVEFDKIRYPLPLEYCGPPDPIILQGTIRRLELELAKTKEELAIKSNNSESRKIYFLQKRVDELTEENLQLNEEIRQLTKMLEIGKKPKHQVVNLQKAVANLEKSVVNERNSHHELVEKLRTDKIKLAKELEKMKNSERCLKARLNRISSTHPSRMGIGDGGKVPLKNKISTGSMKTMYRRSKSPFNIRKDCCDHKREKSAKKSDHHLECKKSDENFEWSLMGHRRTSKERLRPRSRSSSISSTKFQDPFETASTSRCRSRTASPNPQRSRSHTPIITSSNCSGGSSSSIPHSPIRSKSKKEELDFRKLEYKIASLQKLLKYNKKK